MPCCEIYAVKIDISTKVNTRAGISSQPKHYKIINDSDTTSSTGKKSSGVNMATNNNLEIDAQHLAENNIKYGSVIKLNQTMLQISHTSSDKINAIKLAKLYLYADSNLGYLELGIQDSATKIMKVDASSIAYGAGNEGLKYINSKIGYINATKNDNDSKNMSAAYLTKPNIHYDEKYSKSNKISYYSPDFKGLNLGISFSFDSQSRGGLKGIKGNDFGAQLDRGKKLGFKNVFATTLNYNYKIKNFNLKLSSAIQIGEAKKRQNASNARDKYHNLKAYNFGGLVNYQNLSLAGSYGYNGKSELTKETSSEFIYNAPTKYYTLGAAYDLNNKLGISLTHFSSKRQYNRFNAIMLGTDYKLAEGAVIYLQGSHYEFNPLPSLTYTSSSNLNQLITKARSQVLIIGTKVYF